ncbi:MAG: DUF2235 domain-containing protein [bacterium]|jgi:uncharacterized protein (DUF2235 family)
MKNIIICCDGTGNEYSENLTNVVHTYAVAKQNEHQVAFYDPGVGTGGWEYEEESGLLKAKSDQATGYGLQKNVVDAYKILMDKYEEGDKIFLFGFSRGAFTVRSLGGMLYKCGLLRHDNENLVEYAAKIYNTSGNAELARGFRKTFGRSCPVHFIGVWDTVESLILNANKKFHDAKLNPEISFGYHALSIDEKRKSFVPFPWDGESKAPHQTIEQVWFAGVHSDVGGWYTEKGLSNIAFRWMMEKAEACGMEVDHQKLSKFRGDPLDQLHNSYSGIWKVMGRRTRKLPTGSKIHRTVMERMNNPSVKYKPKNLPADYEVVD